MVNYPNAKINLGLRVLRRRADGFHDIETVMFPVKGLSDTLEVVKKCDSMISKESWYRKYHDKVIAGSGGIEAGRNLTFSQSGVPEGLDPEDNLCVKAFSLYCDAVQLDDDYHIHLLKGIPAGAGLGGGSSDAAFVLQMMNRLNRNLLSHEALKAMAAELGSDCPFFLNNEPALATGRGEILEPVNVELKGMYLVILDPAIHVDTGKAYSAIIPVDNGSNKPSEVISLPPDEWKSTLVNDFEPVVFRQHPELGKYKTALYDAGAVYASMSGSGSSVFGIFNNKPILDQMVQNIVVFQSVIG
jgi:4-diphosphocytidyl-2-C-methyl-D-erythritol kinase